MLAKYYLNHELLAFKILLVIFIYCDDIKTYAIVIFQYFLTIWKKYDISFRGGKMEVSKDFYKQPWMAFQRLY